MTNKTSSDRKPPRYGKLDGKPPSKPRGRHAGHSSIARETITLPPTARLGYRIAEFAHLCGVSVPTIYRGIRDKKIDVIELGGIKLVPRSYAIRRGLITSKDTI